MIYQIKARFSQKNVIRSIIENYKENGMWEVKADNDGNYSVIRRQLTEDEYNNCLEILKNLKIMEGKKKNDEAEKLPVFTCFALLSTTIVIVGFIIIGIYVSLFDNSFDEPKNPQPVSDGITAFIENECDFKSDADSFILNLNTIVPFKWDTMAIVFEHRDPESISKTLGIEYEGKSVPDGQIKYLYIYDKKVVYEEQITEPLDEIHSFVPSNPPSFIFTDSLFIVRREGRLGPKSRSGKYYYTLTGVSNRK